MLSGGSPWGNEKEGGLSVGGIRGRPAAEDLCSGARQRRRRMLEHCTPGPWSRRRRRRPARRAAPPRGTRPWAARGARTVAGAPGGRCPRPHPGAARGECGVGSGHGGPPRCASPRMHAVAGGARRGRAAGPRPAPRRTCALPVCEPYRISSGVAAAMAAAARGSARGPPGGRAACAARGARRRLAAPRRRRRGVAGARRVSGTCCFRKALFCPCHRARRLRAGRGTPYTICSSRRVVNVNGRSHIASESPPRPSAPARSPAAQRPGDAKARRCSCRRPTPIRRPIPIRRRIR
jgi:hypothetical protein